ncbi:MAG: HEAT repeat domain-containing protein [Acidobacteriota bacterium]
MNCNLVQEDIVLSVYGELPDERAHQLEQHLTLCERCRQEMEAVAAMHKALSVAPVLEPSPSLLARTRLRLDEALDAIPHAGFFRRLSQRLHRGVGALQDAPVMAAVLLLAGVAGGGYAGYHVAEHSVRASQTIAQNAAPLPVASDIDAAQIAGVSSITLEPDSDNVEVRFERMIPATAFGTLRDPQIRQLLVMAARNYANPAAHDDSVNLLAQECRAGHECSGGPVRNALMVALRYDRDARVRRKALEGLQAYIPVDMRVRDAVLEALLHDSDPDVRAQAIGLLEPVDADSAVREVLQTVASRDQDQHIRSMSKQYLEQVSQIQ